MPVFVFTFQDAMGLAVLAVIILWVLLSALWDWVKQSFCKHDDFYENRACHAICRKCGKDLGFIQPWRDAKNKKQEVKP